MNILMLTLQEYLLGVETGALDPREVISRYVSQLKKDTLFSFVRIHENYLEQHQNGPVL